MGVETVKESSITRRDSFLPFAAPSIGEEEIAAVVETLRGGWLTSGPKVLKFESAFAERVGAKHAIAVNSCTAALHLALEAAGVGPGDEVLTTPMTFAATATVIIHLGARPIFVDIDPVTMNIEPELVAKRASKSGSLKAVLPVHIAGLSCDMDPILETAAQHGLRVVEDAAHCFPTKYKGRMVGSIGDVTCFSFYATKTVVTGEGGMSTTDDDAMAERMRLMRLHGMSAGAWNRYTDAGRWRYEIEAPGYKYNMPEISAALGLVQLAKADTLAERRRDIARRYSVAFENLSEFIETPADAPIDGQHSWHLYIIKLKLDRLTIDRNQFIETMREANIGTSVHFVPLHLQPYYRRTYGLQPDDFPHCRQVFNRIVSLPIYPLMADDDIESVIDAVHAVCTRFAK